MKEVWKDIPNFEGVYQASTHGRIKRVANGPSTHNNRLLKPTRHHSGYMEVSLCKDGKQYKSLRIHMLILITFVGERPNKQECRHLDGNRQNNMLSNLTWGTHKENMQDRIKHGKYIAPKGSLNNLAKLTETQVLEIKKLLGSTLKNKHNQGLKLKEIAKRYKVSISAISYIKIRKTWKHMEKQDGKSIK
ncbi:MAG: NUMOD4 domain-containing protein [Candidatus Neomarinimicrobiota bacterium]